MNHFWCKNWMYCASFTPFALYTWHPLTLQVCNVILKVIPLTQLAAERGPRLCSCLFTLCWVGRGRKHMWRLVKLTFSADVFQLTGWPHAALQSTSNISLDQKFRRPAHWYQQHFKAISPREDYWTARTSVRRRPRVTGLWPHTAPRMKTTRRPSRSREEDLRLVTADTGRVSGLYGIVKGVSILTGRGRRSDPLVSRS